MSKAWLIVSLGAFVVVIGPYWGCAELHMSFIHVFGPDLLHVNRDHIEQRIRGYLSIAIVGLDDPLVS